MYLVFPSNFTDVGLWNFITGTFRTQCNHQQRALSIFWINYLFIPTKYSRNFPFTLTFPFLKYQMCSYVGRGVQNTFTFQHLPNPYTSCHISPSQLHPFNPGHCHLQPGHSCKPLTGSFCPLKQTNKQTNKKPQNLS